MDVSDELCLFSLRIEANKKVSISYIDIPSDYVASDKSSMDLHIFIPSGAWKALAENRKSFVGDLITFS